MRILILCSFLIVSILTHSLACELYSGWEPWPPYQYIHPKSGELTGLDIELITAILKNMGCKPKFIKINWKANLLRLKNGSIDFSMGASLSADREAYAYFSNPYRVERVNLFVLKGVSGQYHFTELSDIIGTKFILGVTSGFYYGKEYASLLDNPLFRKNINETLADEPHPKMLLMGRIDGFLMDNISADEILNRQGIADKIEIHPIKIYRCNIHVIFSKKKVAPDMVERFNDGLKQLKNSEKYKRILKKYAIQSDDF